MSRHYHLLVGQRGEHFASLTFRKVANWYCRVLKPGRDIQQRLMMIEHVADFDSIVTDLRAQGPPPNWNTVPNRRSPFPRDRSRIGRFSVALEWPLENYVPPRRGEGYSEDP